jgi:hypothetical protein
MASAVARLVTYTGTCAATLALRRPVFASTVAPPTFVIPLGPVVPIAAVIISIAILAGASREQLAAGVLALAAGALLLGISEASRRRVPSPPERGRGVG